MEDKSIKLVDAARNNKIEEIKVLLNSGADVNYMDLAALRISARKGYFEFAKVLAKHCDIEIAIAKAKSDDDKITFAHLNILKAKI